MFRKALVIRWLKKFDLGVVFLPDLSLYITHSYFLNPPATKFQTAVNAKKLNHQPVAGKITPRTIACSITPAIKYCFKVIFCPFCKTFLPYRINIITD